MAEHEHITGDALLLALGSEYTTAWNASAAFEEASADWEGAAETYLTSQNEAHFERAMSILETICMLPATGIAGALVQINALHHFAGAESDQLYLSRRYDCLREHALASIWRATGGAAPKDLIEQIGAMGFFDPVRDPFVTDVAAYLETMKAFFEENDMELLPKRGTQRRRATAHGRGAPSVEKGA